MKHIVIVNGTGGSGKTTFAKFIKKYSVAYCISSVDEVKRIACEIGWDGRKSEKDRRFLSDLKLLMTDYNDAPFKYLQKEVTRFYNEMLNCEIMTIDIREPKEIQKAVDEFGAKTLLIRNNRIKTITSNMADANTENYNYDYIIENNGSLKDLEDKTIEFIEWLRGMNNGN